ncbi:PBP1A family penicillin-binding protein [Sulfurihydrogenibium sp.]|uniref:penicillin-binding protein 1A n=1 Tax=Sulfurihydrogenibium sp. TaxID=2053621 RepID=UPI002612FF0A|nr:PBP1A family penicillin-binding protein [Sulfurihydrogenibium sp.]
MNRVLLLILGVFSVFFLFFGVYVFIITRDLPDVRQLENWKPPEASVILDYQDKIYNELYVQKRYYVPISKIPDYVKKAFIATEDKTFYSNPGIDVFGILRAAIKNIIKMGAAEGGSTISQQLAKNLFLTPEKSISRKIKEIVLAIRLNKVYSKDKILEMYLNQIYLGQGSYGVEAAARTYFGKSISQVDLCEAAVLAGLPKAPSKYNPYVNPDLAEKRKQIVLQRMLEEGYISNDDYQRCVERPIKLAGIVRSDNFNDYFTEMIRQWVVDRYGEDAVSQGGLKIYTTIDTVLQLYAQKRVQQWLEELQNRVGFPKLSKEDLDYLKERYDNQKVSPDTLIKNYIYVAKVNQINRGKIKFSIDQVEGEAFVKNVGALKSGDYIYVKYLENGSFKILPFLETAVVSIDSKSGGIRVLIGGYEFRKSQFNRVFQSKRQPGSAIKPIIYMAAILNGYTQISYLEDKPISFWDYSQNKEWVPKNYDGNYYGTVTLRKALAKSLNAATVYLLSQIDFDPVLSVAYKVGIKQKLPKYYSLALGSIELTPIELANAFATFGNYGTRCEPYFIRKVVDKEGNILYQQEPKCEEVLPKPESAVMVDLLRAVVLEGTAVKASSMSVPVAGKTGTTNDYSDAWFAGFDPDLTTVVWVGYDKRKTIGKGITGAEGALPLWIDIMTYANRSGTYKEFPKVEGTVYIPIDPITNKVSNENCPGRYILFVEGTYPTVDCDGNQVDFSKLFAKPEESTPQPQENPSPEETNPQPQENPSTNENEKDKILDILKNR